MSIEESSPADDHAEPIESVVEIEIDAGQAVSFASYQNHIPLVHSLTITNKTDRNYVQVEVSVRVEPAFADPVVFRYEELRAGERRFITPVVLRILHHYLAQLTEEEQGSLIVEVRAAGETIAHLVRPVSVLAYDQWGGTATVPELLAAFVTPNHPHVDRLLSEAGTILSSGSGNPSLTGYDSSNRETIWTQVSAIYSALTRRQIQYSMPPASFADSGQKVRFADRILTGGVGTCLDLTLLLAGCLEQAHLNPVVLIRNGHSWVGCWLINTSFPTALMDDPLAIKKRIDSGEMIAIETTLLTSGHGQSLRLAIERGASQLEQEADSFRYAIDIRRARLEQVLPLPSRDAAPLEDRGVLASSAGLELPPTLPPLVSSAILLDEDPVIETPAGRLGRWQAKLLDLTLRNRLLNFKPNKTMLKLTVPDPAHLEDTLSDGRSWKFRALPPIMEGSDPRSRAQARARDGEDPVMAMAIEAMAKHELMANIEASKLDKTLYEIFLVVRNSIEETGANSLYLALGFLRWTEDEDAEGTHLAPILLVPVTLERASVRSGFSVKRHDDDIIVNPTLLQALRDKHDLNIKGMEPPPQDEHGVDVAKVWAHFREAVKDIPRWEVIEDVYLGIFSFHKFVMYSDLRNREADLRRSPIVSHLLDKPREPLSSDDISGCDDIDLTHGPADLLAPLSADSSQMNAIRRMSEGRDFVLKGPPGTGKSQSITNMIVDALANGRKVLFVSEKIAALSVVERRLNDVGVGPFCLQLHSSKAVKAEVLRQMNATLSHGSTREPHEWELEVERLGRLRRDLNGLVDALHHRHANGLSAYDAMQMAIGHPHWPQIPLSLADGQDLHLRGLDKLREWSRHLQAVAVGLGGQLIQEFRSLRHADWSNTWEAQLMEAAAELDAAVLELSKAAQDLEPSLGVGLTHPSRRMLNDTDLLSGVLLESPSVPAAFAGQGDRSKVRRGLAELRQHGLRRNAAWANLAPLAKPGIARLNGIELQDAWAIAQSKWALPRWFAQRAVAARMIPYTLSGKRPTTAKMPAAMAELVELNEHDAALKAAQATASELLDDVYQGEATDWDAVRHCEEWGERLERVLDRFARPEDAAARDALALRVRDLATRGRALLNAGGPLALRLNRYREAVRRFNAGHAAVGALVNNADFSSGDEHNTNLLPLVQQQLSRWREHRPSIRQWCQWNALRGAASEFGAREVVASIERGAVRTQDIADFIDFSYQTWWLKKTMDRDDVLRTFSGDSHDQKILDFRAADERFQQLTRKLVVARLSRGLAGLTQTPGRAAGPEMSLLLREIAKQRAHLPIRKLIQSIPGVLPNIKPCLLMSPLSVAQYLDPSHPPFDLVIFDEASQIPVWDAVGVIARGKQVIVVGDPKQLPPTAFFDRGDSEDEGAGESEDSVPQDLESILDESLASGMATLSLDWHYRSAHESLIAFSNQRYYDSRLMTFPSPVTRDTAVKLVQVNGIYDRGASQTNRAEAEAVVKRLVEHFKSPDEDLRRKTVGVVTFNAKQMRLIDDLLNAEIAQDVTLEEQMKAHGDEAPFIKNLESVQGDERDIILFSTTFGTDAAGRRSMNFGPLNQQGGERRLNVAVTRARTAVEIFTSLNPEDIDLSKTRAAGVTDLKAYLDYARRGPVALAEEASFTGREPDSPFEREVMDVLREAGWDVHPQVGCSGYRIDIGVVDQRAPGRYIVGVECDGATYHGMASARDRDRLRQSVLEGLGWRLVRVWSTDWWANRTKAKAALLDKVRAAQN